MSPLELRARFESGAIDKASYIREMLACHQALFDYPALLQGTDVAAIEIGADGLAFRLGDMPYAMECPPGEARVAPLEILNFRRYEPAETAALQPLLGGVRTVLDIGANIGWFSLWFAHHCPQAAVHAFEPMPASQHWLRRNIERNGLAARIRAHDVALSDRAGEFDLHVYPTGSTNVSLANVSGAADAVRVRCRTERLDDWARAAGVTPDLIKCDVEGAELLVFRGAPGVLRDARPIVFTEMLRKWSQPFGYHPNEVIDLFAGLGYACRAVTAQGLAPFERMTDSSVETNFIFLHRERHASLLEAGR